MHKKLLLLLFVLLTLFVVGISPKSVSAQNVRCDVYFNPQNGMIPFGNVYYTDPGESAYLSYLSPEGHVTPFITESVGYPMSENIGWPIYYGGVPQSTVPLTGGPAQYNWAQYQLDNRCDAQAGEQCTIEKSVALSTITNQNVVTERGLPPGKYYIWCNSLIYSGWDGLPHLCSGHPFCYYEPLPTHKFVPNTSSSNNYCTNMGLSSCSTNDNLTLYVTPNIDKPNPATCANLVNGNSSDSNKTFTVNFSRQGNLASRFIEVSIPNVTLYYVAIPPGQNSYTYTGPSSQTVRITLYAFSWDGTPITSRTVESLANEVACPFVNGNWCGWGAWQGGDYPYNGTCGSVYREHYCQCPGPQNGGSGCVPTGAQYFSNGGGANAFERDYGWFAPPAAQSCPAYCHTNTIYVNNGTCGGVDTCVSNAPPAGSCNNDPGYPGGYVPDGACGQIYCPPVAAISYPTTPYNGYALKACRQYNSVTGSPEFNQGTLTFGWQGGQPRDGYYLYSYWNALATNPSPAYASQHPYPNLNSGVNYTLGVWAYLFVNPLGYFYSPSPLYITSSLNCFPLSEPTPVFEQTCGGLNGEQSQIKVTWYYDPRSVDMYYNDSTFANWRSTPGSGINPANSTFTYNVNTSPYQQIYANYITYTTWSDPSSAAADTGNLLTKGTRANYSGPGQIVAYQNGGTLYYVNTYDVTEFPSTVVGPVCAPAVITGAVNASCSNPGTLNWTGTAMQQSGTSGFWVGIAPYCPQGNINCAYNNGWYAKWVEVPTNVSSASTTMPRDISTEGFTNANANYALTPGNYVVWVWNGKNSDTYPYTISNCQPSINFDFSTNGINWSSGNITAPSNSQGTLRWSVPNATSCTGTGQGFDTPASKTVPAGNQSVGGLTVGNYTYSLTCSRTGYSPVSSSINVSVYDPPFIDTTGGDVHSNENIVTPGR